MRQEKYYYFPLLLGIAFIMNGCAGYNRSLLVSRSNVGIDIDRQPPNAEIGISRDEVAVQPVFEGGQTTPAYMSMSVDANVNFLQRFMFGMGSFFSTGKAAALVVSKGEEAESTGEIAVTKAPNPGMLFGKVRDKTRPALELVKPGEAAPLVVATKTGLGVRMD